MRLHTSLPARFSRHGSNILDLQAIAMIWLREMVRLKRQPNRFFGSIAYALIWLLALGGGLRHAVPSLNGIAYEQFVFPGVMAMSIIFNGFQSALSLIYDREFGFLKEVLVAPTPRSTMVIGKCLGGASRATVQGMTILIFAPLAGVSLTPLSVLFTLGCLFLISSTVCSLGILIAVCKVDLDHFSTIRNFVTLMLYMFSGAVFPHTGAPPWLNFLLTLNPLTYGVDALRSVLIGYQEKSVGLDLIVLGVFTLLLLLSANLVAQREM